MRVIMSVGVVQGNGNDVAEGDGNYVGGWV